MTFCSSRQTEEDDTEGQCKWGGNLLFSLLCFLEHWGNCIIIKSYSFCFLLIRNVFSWPFQDSKWSMKLTIFNVQAPSEATSQTKTKVIWEWQIRISHRPIIQFWEGNLWPKSTAALSCHDEFIKQKVKTEIFVQNYFKRHFCITLWSKI